MCVTVLSTNRPRSGDGQKKHVTFHSTLLFPAFCGNEAIRNLLFTGNRRTKDRTLSFGGSFGSDSNFCPAPCAVCSFRRHSAIITYVVVFPFWYLWCSGKNIMRIMVDLKILPYLFSSGAGGDVLDCAELCTRAY